MNSDVNHRNLIAWMMWKMAENRKSQILLPSLSIILLFLNEFSLTAACICANVSALQKNWSFHVVFNCFMFDLWIFLFQFQLKLWVKIGKNSGLRNIITNLFVASLPTVCNCVCSACRIVWGNIVVNKQFSSRY